MQIEIFNDFYVRTDNRIGPWTITSSQQPSSQQIHNAEKVYNYLHSLGWSVSAICGIIGNMQHESSLDPAFIQETNRWRLPNRAANLSDVPNSVMQHFFNEYYNDPHKNYGIGLVQWDGKGITRQKLVGYCMDNNYIWYDGMAQLARLENEQSRGIQWQTKTMYGTSWTWSNFVHNNRSPEDSASIFRACYEVALAGVSETRGNARWWYDYFSDNPPTPIPDDWVSGEDFADVAYSYKDSGYTYQDYDCIGFVNLVWKNTQDPARSANLTNGTNSIWRSTRTFNTSYDNMSPVPELYWKGTIEECEESFGDIPQGALLFRCIPEGQPGYDTIPSQYYGDGIGNFTHVGIYVSPLGGAGSVMQSGGYGGTGVHLSGWRDDYWTHVAFVCYVYYEDQEEEEEDETPLYYAGLLAKRKKGGRIVRVYESSV